MIRSSAHPLAFRPGTCCRPLHHTLLSLPFVFLCHHGLPSTTGSSRAVKAQRAPCDARAHRCIECLYRRLDFFLTSARSALVVAAAKGAQCDGDASPRPVTGARSSPSRVFRIDVAENPRRRPLKSSASRWKSSDFGSLLGGPSESDSRLSLPALPPAAYSATRCLLWHVPV